MDRRRCHMHDPKARENLSRNPSRDERRHKYFARYHLANYQNQFFCLICFNCNSYMVLIVTKKQIYKKNALKRSFYMFACERCARKIYTCYTEDTKMVHTQHSSHLNPRWRLVIHAALRKQT